MKKGLLFLLGIFTLLLSTACDDESDRVINIDGNYGRISGYILSYQDNKDIGDVVITTIPATSSVTSNYYGFYELTNLPDGEYTVVAEKYGFYTKYTDVYVRDGKTTTCTIKMRSEKIDNHAPESPIISVTIDKSDPNNIKANIKWDCSDPDSNSVTYDIYYGHYNWDMDKVASNMSKQYIIQNLKQYSNHYCKVVATDEWGATTSSEVVEFKLN